MLKGQIIEQNINLYLKKMEEKYNQGQQKIKELQNRLNKSAYIIQRAFKKYIFYKKTKNARIIQKKWRKILKIKLERKLILDKCKITICKLKIYNFFLKLKYEKLGQKNKKNKFEMKIYTKNPIIQKINKNIRLNCKNYFIIYSSLKTQTSYLNKYLVFDKLSFSSQWQSYEQKQQKWIRQQIKKKWIKKDQKIWINQQQKEINIQKYIKNVIQKSYQKEYYKFQNSQQQLKNKIQQFRLKLIGIQRAYLYSLFK